jgi:hypothetical protein
VPMSEREMKYLGAASRLMEAKRRLLQIEDEEIVFVGDVPSLRHGVSLAALEQMLRHRIVSVIDRVTRQFRHPEFGDALRSEVRALQEIISTDEQILREVKEKEAVYVQ